MSPENFRPYPMNAPSVGRSGGRLKKTLRVVILTAEKERILDLVERRMENGRSNPKYKKKVKHVTEVYKTNSEMSDSDFAFM